MRPATGGAIWREPLLWVLVYTIAVSALFIAFPAIDLKVAALFHRDGGFPALNVPALVTLRRLGDQLVILVMVVLLASVLAKLVWPLRPLGIRPRTGAFLVASLVIGPGLVVNALFKNHSGRPRPIQIDPFGGDWSFVPAWNFDGACITNCSFISGEASTAIWLLALALLAPRPLRLVLALPIAAIGIALSVNRMAFGGHFLSDVMISWGITLLIILILKRVLVDGPAGERIDETVERHLTRFGVRLRRFGAKRR